MTNPTNPLSTLETDLEVLATPSSPFTAPGGGTAVTTPVLATVQELFNLLEGVSAGGTAIKTVADDINTALGGAADALNVVAGELSKIGGSISDVTKVLSALQNGLSTAQSLLPGGPSVTSALQSGSQFFGMLNSLLSDPAITTIEDASTLLFKIAQQLRAISL